MACIVFFLAGIQAVSADSGTPGKPGGGPRLRYRIVVDQGKWTEIHTTQWNMTTEISDGIQAQLVDKLEKSGCFIVLEREAGAVKQQGNEDAVDTINRANEGASSTGMPVRNQRVAGAYIITPSVIGFTQTSGTNSPSARRAARGGNWPGT